MSVIQNRLVPDPAMSDAEYYHQRSVNPGRPNIGRVYVSSNELTRIGALVYIRRRLHHHEMAAERFRNLYEARYGLGVPAMDASREPVDRSPVAHDSGMAAKLDRTRAIESAIDHLGMDAANRIIACVVLCRPCGHMTYDSGWRARHLSVDALLEALEALSEFWGYSQRAA